MSNRSRKRSSKSESHPPPNTTVHSLVTLEAPLSPEAADYRNEIDRRLQEIRYTMSRLPIAALIWGPTPSEETPVSQARRLLQRELILNGHLAYFSEELFDPGLPFSIQAQEYQHIQASDVVFSIPASPGSIAEIHDFARIPGLAHKIVAFLDNRWDNGYSNLSLIQLRSIVTCEIQLYDSGNLPTCIIEKAMDIVRRLQEYYYLTGRRV